MISYANSHLQTPTPNKKSRLPAKLNKNAVKNLQCVHTTTRSTVLFLNIIDKRHYGDACYIKIVRT
jgi:hypothetical protein